MEFDQETDVNTLGAQSGPSNAGMVIFVQNFITHYFRITLYMTRFFFFFFFFFNAPPPIDRSWAYSVRLIRLSVCLSAKSFTLATLYQTIQTFKDSDKETF